MNNAKETALSLGLLEEEFNQICQVLKREPNLCELSIYSVMWSEHCSYKNSIAWLKTLPRESDLLMAKPGEENAGLMDIGEGLGVCFKIESHNHPSAIEPYQGAATGVGGINRDIFSMGARPIAQLNSLRFGRLSNPRTQWLLRGVVKGIGDYGNAFGIPVVGGEVYFEDCYQINPLVNAMSVGIVEKGKTASARAFGIGNKVYIFGSSTGKDGIHGAAFASKDITEDSVNDLPSVQVGDPFWEKLILEATLEIIETGGVIGLQDMGAAGITCSTSEMSAKDGVGMDIHLDRVPLRQSNMKDWEILLSESQERMLVVVKSGFEAQFESLFNKWDLTFACIGEVTNTGCVRYFMNGVLCADIPAESLVLGGGAPVYHREFREPQYIKEISAFRLNQVPELTPGGLSQACHEMATLPNIASKKWVYTQYDSMVGTANQSAQFPSDAAIVKIRGTNRSLAMTVDCNSRYVYADPKKGAAIAVMEAARNIVCSGGTPLGVTNCLNFGNPYNPEVYWQFKGSIEGMGEACRALNIPVTGGNVSFYNQTSDDNAVFPTPTIGMVGLLNSKNQTGSAFQHLKDLIYLIGPATNDLGSSQYIVNLHEISHSNCPEFNIDMELKVQHAVSNLIQENLIHSAHDISEGGLFISLLESALQSNIGFEVRKTSSHSIRLDAWYFGESQSRIVVSIKPENARLLENKLNELEVPYSCIGKTISSDIILDGVTIGNVNSFSKLYEEAIEKMLSN